MNIEKEDLSTEGKFLYGRKLFSTEGSFYQRKEAFK